MNFRDFFGKATGGAEEPFPYQERFARAADLHDLVHAPTGSGKTATAILGWLWRYFHTDNPTPRRLAYCLPMRVLVEQTASEAKRWINQLQLPVSVHVLMGGEDVEDWDLEPESPAILIGTQDMLLSRALNRGYGMSRYRWPMHFGLLNNDCLWVLDEIQLMGVGLATSAQLQAFRERFGTFGKVSTVWMSATLRPDWLGTVDFRDRVPSLSKLHLTDEDFAAPGLRDRWQASKLIEPSGLRAGDAKGVASLVKSKHIPGSLTLVVVNTVERSRKVFEELRTLYQAGQTKGRGKKSSGPSDPASLAPDLKLIHSRFRPMERERWMEWLKEKPPGEGRIVISTQVVEAGVDMSARTLVTELAPWPSLVQRLGRCNRRGEFKEDNRAQIYWIDVPAKDDKQAAPYTRIELDEARKHMRSLKDGGPRSLHEFQESLSDGDQAILFPFDPPHVVRRKDFVDLFDTTPDLAGNDIDVSRFIREGDDLDVQAFWRSHPPPRDEIKHEEARRIAPVRTELCPVPLGSFREFVRAGRGAYHWDALEGRWIEAAPDAIFPGQVFWVPKDRGGYSRELGWDPNAAWSDDLQIYTPSDDVPLTTEPAYDSDLLSVFGWQTIAEHTAEVMDELEAMDQVAELLGVPIDCLRVALRWHDWGKAHAVFQDRIQDGSDGQHLRPTERAERKDIAKAPGEFWGRVGRKHFRHELASAMAVLTLLRKGAPPPDWARLSTEQQNLALYLVAAHHGKVRLSIRSMPDEARPNAPDCLFARGVHGGDLLAGVDLGGGQMSASIPIDLSPMRLGRGEDGSPSWAERMLGLRDRPDIGPLRMAFLEAVVRACDMRASKKADQKARG